MLDGQIKIGKRAVDVALRAKGNAAVDVGLRMPRIELDRLRQVRDGTVKIALSGIGIAAVVQRQRAGRA